MSPRRAALRNLLLESAIYIPLVTAYFFLVLRLLGHTLYVASKGESHQYALLALAVLLGQAIVLDALARVIMRVLR